MFLSPTAAMLAFGLLASAQSRTDESFVFSTRTRKIQMQVTYPPIYRGTRLSVLQEANSGKELCLPLTPGTTKCAERFVGALALVRFHVTRATNGKAAADSIREYVTLIAQSPGLPDRPPFTVSIDLVKGIGSDVQLFGYDESSVPKQARAAERRAAEATWRRFQQKLFLGSERDPFAIIEWRHTIAGISIVQAQGKLERH